MILTVNGTPREVEEDITLQELAPGGRGIAIARNGEVVPRTSWAEERLEPGDRVEILNAVAGG